MAKKAQGSQGRPTPQGGGFGQGGSLTPQVQLSNQLNQQGDAPIPRSRMGAAQWGGQNPPWANGNPNRGQAAQAQAMNQGQSPNSPHQGQISQAMSQMNIPDFPKVPAGVPQGVPQEWQGRVDDMQARVAQGRADMQGRVDQFRDQFPQGGQGQSQAGQGWKGHQAQIAQYLQNKFGGNTMAQHASSSSPDHQQAPGRNNMVQKLQSGLASAKAKHGTVPVES